MTVFRWPEAGDFLGRVGIASYFSAAATLKVLGIFETLRNWNTHPGESRMLSLLSDMATLIFLGLVIAVAAFRLRPSKSASGIEPRLTALAGTFLLVFLTLLPPSQSPPTIATILGLCFAIAGSLLSAYVLLWLGRSFSIVPEARRLITGGPYGIVRHPLYMTEELATIGIVLLHWSLIAVALACLQLGLQLRRMYIEEKVLGAAFPEEYAAYAKRTPRFVPGRCLARQPA